jgi:tetratricopeptide (TPR) repeat protein
MDQTDYLLNRADETTLPPDELVRLRCRLAKELEDKGDYEAARRALAPFWPRAGERPAIDGLSDATSAEVLLRAGVLKGWSGSAHQIQGAQEAAKDLISDSLSIFEKLQLKEKAAEAEVELAYCYWREGALDEARVLIQKALDRLDDNSGEIKAVALLRKALVESAATRFGDSLRILLESAPLFEASDSHALKGRFHNELAYNFQSLASAEGFADYTDRAIVEFTAASFHFEQAGHVRYRAHVENNLGLLLHGLGKFGEAHEHLDRAGRLFSGLKDWVYLAQVDETRARVFLAQGRAAEAEKKARAASRAFVKAGEDALLAETLTTHGKALAQLERVDEARSTLERAVAVAERAGSNESGGLALLTLIEELGEHLGAGEFRASYKRADELLARSQHPEIIARLRHAARLALDAQPSTGEAHVLPPSTIAPGEFQHTGDELKVESLINDILERYRKQVSFPPEAVEAVRRLFLTDNAPALGSLLEQTIAAASPGAVITADAVEVVALRRRRPLGNFAQPWADFSLKDEMRQPEKRFIELALKAAEGKVSVAARLLGFNHNELLTSIIKTRYPELLTMRTPAIPRKRSIIGKSPRRRRRS